MSDYSAAWCEENPGAASLTIERLRNEVQRHRVRREQEKLATIEECAKVAETYQGPRSLGDAIRTLKEKE